MDGCSATSQLVIPIYSCQESNILVILVLNLCKCFVVVLFSIYLSNLYFDNIRRVFENRFQVVSTRACVLFCCIFKGDLWSGCTAELFLKDGEPCRLTDTVAGLG